jgi:hypothetical protein
MEKARADITIAFDEARADAAVAVAEHAKANTRALEERALEIEKEIDVAQKAKAAAIDDVTSAISRQFAVVARGRPEFEAFTGAIGTTAQAWGDYAKGQGGVADAVAATSTVIGPAIASQIKGKREQAGVEALFEAAAAIASFATGNIQGGIAHTAAAVAFGAVATGIVKPAPAAGATAAARPAGAAARLGGAAAGGAGAGEAGPAVTRIEVMGGFMTQREVVRGFREAERTERGTGSARRRGV